jgi:hypothetical protein
MNSIIQALACNPIFVFELQQQLLQETNLVNGRPVSEALKKLIDQIKEDTPQTTICPSDFKATLAKLNSLFVGTE